MAETQSLSVAIPSTSSPISSTITSPTEPRSRSLSPGSPAHRVELPIRTKPNTQAYTKVNDEARSTDDHPGSPTLTSLPPFPPSPKGTPKHLRDQSKSFFSNLKASKSSNKVHTMETTIREVPHTSARGDKDFRENGIYTLRKNTGSTPDLSKSTFDNTSIDVSDGKVSLTT